MANFGEQRHLVVTIAGGCTLIDIGIYPLSTTWFVLESDPIDVQGRTVSTHDAFADVDEHVTFQAAYPDNVSAISLHESQCTAVELSHAARLRRGALEPAFPVGRPRAGHSKREDNQSRLLRSVQPDDLRSSTTLDTASRWGQAHSPTDITAFETCRYSRRRTNLQPIRAGKRSPTRSETVAPSFESVGNEQFGMLAVNDDVVATL